RPFSNGRSTTRCSLPAEIQRATPTLFSFFIAVESSLYVLPPPGEGPRSEVFSKKTGSISERATNSMMSSDLLSSVSSVSISSSVNVTYFPFETSYPRTSSSEETISSCLGHHHLRLTRLPQLSWSRLKCTSSDFVAV